MDFFSDSLDRLKHELRVSKDGEVAAALGLSKTAFSERKKRSSFPEKELKALVQQRPELGVDVLYVLTGERNPTHAMRRGVQLAQQRLNQQQQSMKQAIGLLQSGGGMPVPPAPASQASALTADEVLLLERYRTSPPLLREAALRVLNQVPVDQGAEG